MILGCHFILRDIHPGSVKVVLSCQLEYSAQHWLLNIMARRDSSSLSVALRRTLLAPFLCLYLEWWEFKRAALLVFRS
jgi:hypothetical protein